MWNSDYPGAQHGQYQQPQGGYAPPPGGPGYGGYGGPPPGPPPGQGGFGFPSAGGGYNSPGYGPPPGPPGGGYGAPPGPPGGGYGGPPGGGYGGPPGPPGGGYGPPSGPPGGGYGPPPGPPGGGYGAPPGPPGGGYSSPPPGPPPNMYNGGSYGPPPGPPGGGYGGGGYGGAFEPPPSGPIHPPPSGTQNYGPQFQDSNNQVQQPFFQYSQCNGKKKALCIGVNYTGTSSELRGCINDARNVRDFLCRQFGYRDEDIVMLTDDAPNIRQIPTRENMLAAMQWLVRDAQPNDSLFFHYSGHGGQTKDLDGDEDDGNDEVIYPVDHEEAGHIVDDDMHMIMVRPLPPGCRLTAIFDSCHSGTALDLPYIYSTEGKIKEPNLAAEAGQGVLQAGMAYMRGDMGGVFKSVTGLLKTATGNSQKAEAYARATRTSPADVISWSGCKDSQTSADTSEAGKATGAMSWAFMETLSQNPQQSYQQLLNSIRDLLRAKYSQKPQLSSSHPMDTTILFIA